MIESHIICPKCYSLLQKKDDKIVCTNCNTEFQEGEKINLSLGELVKIKRKESAAIKKLQPKPKKPHIIKKRRKRHSTGFYAVTRIPPRRGKPRGAWRYRSKIFGLNVCRVDLDTLKNDILKLGGEWVIVDEEVAEKSMEIDRRSRDV